MTPGYNTGARPDLHVMPPPDPWFPLQRPGADARLRLIALPFAGGAASAYRTWQDELPAWVEVCPVQLPGRETRFREPPFTRLAPLVGSLAEALTAYPDRPFALFGHSFGALIAFELARELRRQGLPRPQRLIVSGRGAPHLPPRHAPFHLLPDRQLLDELRRLNGTPAAVLDHDELVRLILPTLRADFTAHETYSHTDEPPLDVPILALGGVQDRLAPFADLDAWRQHTAAGFELRMLPGDHFFIQSQRTLVLQCLSRYLGAAEPA